MDTLNIVKQQIADSAETKMRMLRDEYVLSQIAEAAEICTNAYKKGNKVL